MSLSGALTQLLLYADRFIIGAMLTLTAVAFYATPLDLIMRLWIIPVAVAQTMLPAIASSFRELPDHTALLIKRGALIVMLLSLPASLILIPGAELFLRLWLGTEFAVRFAGSDRPAGCDGEVLTGAGSDFPAAQRGTTALAWH